MPVYRGSQSFVIERRSFIDSMVKLPSLPSDYQVNVGFCLISIQLYVSLEHVNNWEANRD